MNSYWYYAFRYFKKYLLDNILILLLWGVMIWLGILLAFYMKTAVDAVAAGTLPIADLLAIVILAAAIPLLNFVSEYKANILAGKLVLDISGEIIASTIRTGGKRDSSDVLSRISGDVLNATIYLNLWLDLGLIVARLLAQVAAAFYISPVLTLAAVPFIALYLFVSGKIGPAILAHTQRERVLYTAWFKRVKEAVDGAHSLYRVGIVKLPKVLVEAAAEWFKGYRKLQLYSKGLSFGANALAYGVPNGAFVLGLFLTPMGMATVGVALAVRQLLAQVFEPAAQLMMKVGSIYQLKVSFQRVAELIEAKCDRIMTVDAAGPRVVVENAVLGYGGVPVLRVESLVIGPGDFVWVRGPTGSGKSTLGKAIAGLIKPIEGRIETPSGAIYIGNDDYIFDASVYENIDLWEGFPREEVERAARLAQIDFPLDKLCGERGSELSEGQRQRVLVARALLRRPSVLILDEVTSGLNVEVEERVLDAAKREVPIVVVISHRSTAGKYANKIVEVDNGTARVVAPHKNSANLQKSSAFQD